jgi:hypothetical protein
MNTDSKDDYLDEDPIIPSQRFALVSIVSPASVNTGPDFNWKSVTPSGEPWDFRLMKIRYVCETEQQAEKKKLQLQEIDNFHNIYIMPVGRWGPFEDSEEFCEDVEYKDQQANQIMKSFKEQQAKADLYDNERRVTAKKDADRRRKLMDKRNKIKESKANQILKDTDNILANEIIVENLKGIDKLTIEELRAKSAILDATIVTETANKKKRDEKKEEEALEKARLEDERREKRNEIRRLKKEQNDGVSDSDSDVEDIEIPQNVSDTVPIDSTADMIAQDFMKHNADQILTRTDALEKVNEHMDDTVEKLNKQKEVIQRIDDEKRRIQEKIDQLRKNK